jgi:hypothetical protein
MRRDERKKTKAGDGAGHPNPDNHGSREEEDKWNRNVCVSGEISIKVPPDLLSENHPQKEKNDPSGNKTRLVEWLTFAAVVIYAALTGWQVCLTRKAIKSTERFATLDQRPYLYLSENGPPQIIHVPNPQKTATVLAVHLRLSNFGKSPAIHVIGAGEMIVAGDVLKRADAWFESMGIPLKAAYQEKSGTYLLPNGEGVPEDTVMQGREMDFWATQLTGNDSDPPPGVISGRIQYRDTLSNLYWTDFCLLVVEIHDQTGTASNLAAPKCPKHNEIH